MISIRKQIEQSESSLLRFRALRKAYLELTRVLPKAALPVNPELAGQCKEECDRFEALLDETTSAQTIDQAGKAALEQFEAIYHSNRAGIEERDAVLKDVVASVAEAISSFKGRDERHETNLSRLADEFDSLSRVGDLSEIRRRLQKQVGKLRETAQEMRRENDKAVQQFAAQLPAYQQRLEMARKQSGVDRLTGLGSRREAERQLRQFDKQERAVTVLLFDIEGFKAINSRYGALFGDKLLRALSHQLHNRFPEDGMLFRWGADEFLVIVEGSLASWLEQCRDLCQSFATGGKYYTTVDDGSKVALAAAVAFGAAQYTKGESMEELCHRTQMALDQSRQRLRR